MAPSDKKDMRWLVHVRVETWYGNFLDVLYTIVLPDIILLSCDIVQYHMHHVGLGKANSINGVWYVVHRCEHRNAKAIVTVLRSLEIIQFKTSYQLASKSYKLI